MTLNQNSLQEKCGQNGVALVYWLIKKHAQGICAMQLIDSSHIILAKNSGCVCSLGKHQNLE